MLFQRIILVLLLNLAGGFFPVGAQRLGFFIEGKAKKVIIPFKMHNNLIVLPLQVNGKIPMKFILDTGVRSIIFFDKDITDVLGVTYGKRISIHGVGEKKEIVAFIASGFNFEYNNFKGKGLSALVLAEDYLQLRNHLGTEVHGIIGFDFFRRFIVDINYETEVLTLIKPSHFKKKKKFHSVPLEVKNTKPYINVSLQLDDTTNLQVDLMIDTGASNALVLHPDSVGPLRLPPKNIETILGQGLSGEIKGNLAYIKGCAFGGYELKNVVTSYPHKLAYPDSLFMPGRKGTIGGEILSRFHLIFDYYGKKRLYLKKNHSFNGTFLYNMSGLDIIVEGKDLDQFKINNVRKGSPAYLAGLRVGDYIEELNSWDRERLEIGRIYKTMSIKDGKKINMIISRNGIPIRYKFRLKKEI